MAGSGKTTFVQRLAAHLHARNVPPYVINLDPAVHSVPYPANIDIRDTVNYKEVMKQYHMGPNGAITTSLNLFATRFDQVMQFVDKRANECKPHHSRLLLYILSIQFVVSVQSHLCLTCPTHVGG
jgi:GTPase SAR1 family protein